MLAEKLKEAFGGFKLFTATDEQSIKANDYIITQLGDQAIQRAIIQMVETSGEKRFLAFLEFLKGKVNTKILLDYLVALDSENAEKILLEKVAEVLAEFKAEMKLK